MFNTGMTEKVVRRCLMTSAMFMVLTSLAVAGDELADLVADAQSLKMTYWKNTNNETMSRWEIEFSREEILALKWLLKRARPSDSKSLFINAYDGEFRTTNRHFTIRIGERKLVGRPVAFVLQDKMEPGSRQTYELYDEDAEDFNAIFEWALASKSRDLKPMEVRPR